MSAELPAEYQAHEQAPFLAAAYVYCIQHDDGRRVYYSGFDQPITLTNIPVLICPEGEAEFLPSQIKHGNITSNDKFEERACTIHIDTTDTRLRRFFVTAAAVKLRCWIIRIAAESIGSETVDFTSSAVVVESGILSKFAFSGMAIAAEVTPDPYYVNFSIPRYWFQRQCNHALYGEGCNLDKENFAYSSTITAINAAERIITILGKKPGAAANYFEAGMFYHAATGLRYAIGWSDFSGDDTILKLGYWNPELQTGQTVRAYAGCRHIPEDCNSKFNNAPNFGGFPFVPSRNPATNSVI